MEFSSFKVDLTTFTSKSELYKLFEIITKDMDWVTPRNTAENGKKAFNFDILKDKPLRILTENKTPIKIKTNDNLIIKSELSDSDLLGKTNEKGRDSITSLIKKGKDWKFWN